MSCAGFTLIEISLVLVIIGIILSAIGLGWSAVIEGRRMAKTQTALLTARDCLLERIYYSNFYPRYSANLDCDTINNTPAMEFDTCLCDKLDAWGEPIYALIGRQAGTPNPALYDPANPDDIFYIADNFAQGQDATSPDGDESAIIDKDGNVHRFVSIVLISFGRDRTADHDSYGTLLTANNRVDVLPLTTDPDGLANFTFDADQDDIFISVTGPELRSYLAQ